MHQERRKTLKAWRQERGLTQFRLAVAADVSPSTVVNIEAARQEPGVIIAGKIARALGVTVDDIAWPDPDHIRRRPKEKPAA